MGIIMRREIRNYFKNPCFWAGLVIVICGMYQMLHPYLEIRFLTSEKEMSGISKNEGDDDITNGYVPTEESKRREIWEQILSETFISAFGMSEAESQAVIQEISDMDIAQACDYLEETYSYFDAANVYRYDTCSHPGTMEEMNAYLEDRLRDKSFSWYFSRKFADFAGLFMAFFAVLLLALLFYQDTRKRTYELLHTKPVSAAAYVCGKAAGGYAVLMTALAVLNVVYYALCLFETRGSGFEVRLRDFLGASGMYIMPNMLMIVCVYTFTSLLFRNPLPAVPVLFLYIVYSNMGSRNAEGFYGYYGRPLAIMVRFPGQFFETAPPPLALWNQCFLLMASGVILFLSVQLWKKRRI